MRKGRGEEDMTAAIPVEGNIEVSNLSSLDSIPRHEERVLFPSRSHQRQRLDGMWGTCLISVR